MRGCFMLGCCLLWGCGAVEAQSPSPTIEDLPQADPPDDRFAYLCEACER